MKQQSNFPPEVRSQPLAPGEKPRAGDGRVWLAVVVAVVGLIAVLLLPRLEALRTQGEAILASVTQPPAPPPARQAPHRDAAAAHPPRASAVPAKPAAKPATPPAAPSDDLARPLAFYFARWGVSEALSPIGWTSRVEIRAGAGGGASAHVWITCPKGLCDAGEFPVNPVAHLQKKDMTAYVAIERRESDKVWTLLLRPAPGRPDELERWEWFSPPGSNVRTQSLLGHIRRIRADGK